jgi:hypothetical protein
MIHLYNKYPNNQITIDNKILIDEGIKYLITQQQADGSFINWNFRPNQTTPNTNNSIGNNTTHPYETSNALATLCEGLMFFKKYNYTIPSNLEITIEKAANNLTYDITDGQLDNSNFKGLVAWSLSKAFKVTQNCNYLKRAQAICLMLINDQTKDGGLCDGMWQTGGEEQPSMIMHDSHIHYHMIILKGLIETFDILPNTMSAYKTNLLNTINRGINHVISKRLSLGYVNGSNVFGALRLDYTNNDCLTVEQKFGFYYFSDVVEPIALLAYYSNYHLDYFTNNDRSNLKNLLNIISWEVKNKTDTNVPNQSIIFCVNNLPGLSYYLDYYNALKTNTKIFQEDSPKIRNYNANKLVNRILTGDFDNDGKLDDVAAFYDYGMSESRIHVWKTDVPNYVEYSGSNGWWQSSGYDATKIVSLNVGDIDNDGYKDDIIAFYDYGNSIAKIHVWVGEKTYFRYVSSNGLWSSSGYNANMIKGRVEIGDFDHDNYEDDIIAFYDYGNSNTRIHYWIGRKNDFYYVGPNGLWSTSGYDANKITGRVVVGDFNNNGFKDDICAFYDYGNSNTTIHGWYGSTSTVNYLGAYGLWRSSGYDATKITNRVCVANMDYDNYLDDIVVFYDYNNTETRAHLFSGFNSFISYNGANGIFSSIGYSASKINGRIASGCFNNYASDNIVNDFYTFYDYSNDETRIHSFIRNASNGSLDYSGSGGVWVECYPSTNLTLNLKQSNEQQSSFNEVGEDYIKNQEYISFPNPIKNTLTIECKYDLENNLDIFVLDPINLKQFKPTIISKNNNQIKLDFSELELSNGIYILTIKSNNNLKFKKLIEVKK